MRGVTRAPVVSVVPMLSPDDPRQFGKLYAHGRARDNAIGIAIDAHSHTEREQQLISQNLKLVQLLNKQSQMSLSESSQHHQEDVFDSPTES